MLDQAAWWAWKKLNQWESWLEHTIFIPLRQEAAFVRCNVHMVREEKQDEAKRPGWRGKVN